MTNRSRQKALNQVLPLLCRAVPERDDERGPTKLYATDDGREVTPQMRDELLAKCKDGDYVEIDIPMLAYEQRPGKPNRNFVRFADAEIPRLAKTGRGVPFLRDHQQHDSLARGGTVVKSEGEKIGDGHYAIRQTARLTAPWAVEMALRGLMDRPSIGWWPTGPIECSACGTEVFTECYHWPGDRVSISTAPDGSKQYVRDPEGDVVVEWVYTKAELIETSTVVVPGVPGASIDDARAVLSASFPELAALGAAPPQERAPAEAESATQATPSDAGQAKEPTMPTETEMQAQIEKLTKERDEANKRAETLAAEQAQKLADQQIEQRIAERDARVAEARKLATELSLDADKAAELATSLKSFDEVKLKLFDMKVEQQKAQTILGTNRDPAIRAGQVSVGLNAVQKVFHVAKHGLLARISGAEPKDVVEKKLGLRISAEDIAYFAQLSLMSIGDELLEANGVDVRKLRTLGRFEKAKLLMGHKSARVPGITTLAAGGMGSSDLSGLVGAVFGARLQQLYKDFPDDWLRLAKKVDKEDFTSTPIFSLSNFPPLKKVPEGAPMDRGAFKPANFNSQLEKGGIILTLTWEMIVNDTLGALDLIINDRFQSCKRYERAELIRVLLAGKIGTSNTNFFNSSGVVNICPTTGVVSATTIAAAFATMAKIRGVPGVTGAADASGDRLRLMPKGLLAGASDAIAAHQLLDPSDNGEPAKVSPSGASSRMTSAMRALANNIVVEPDLDDQTPPFSLFTADPNECAAIEYGHLVDQPGPFVEEQDGFEIQGKDYAVVDPFYVVLADPRGAVKVTHS